MDNYSDDVNQLTEEDYEEEEYMTWDEAIERFEDLLNAHGDFHTGYASGETTIQPSYALRKCDPVAYRTSFNDWAHFEGIDTDKLRGEERLP